MTPKRFIAMGLFCALALAACSSGGAGGTGSDEGSFVVADVVSSRDQVLGQDRLLIHIASVPGLCGLFTTGADTPDRDYDIIVIELNITGTLAPGVKTIAGELQYSQTEGTAFYTGNRGCNTRYGGYATGTVNLTTLDDGHAAGTYDLHFANGWPYSGGIQGSFNAPTCNTMGRLPYLACK